MSRARESRAVTKMLDSCKVRDLARMVRKERTDKAKDVITCPPYAYNHPELMDGILIYYLVHEFLESLELYNTLAVFSREATFDSKNYIEYHPIMGLEWFLKSFFMSDKYQGLLPILLRFYKSAGKRVRDRRRRNGDLAMAVEKAELEEMQKELTGQLNGTTEFRGCNLVTSNRGGEGTNKPSHGGCQKSACTRNEKPPVSCNRTNRTRIESVSAIAQEEQIPETQTNSTAKQNFRTSTPNLENQNEGSTPTEQDPEPLPESRSCGRQSQPIDLSRRPEAPRSCPRKETCPGSTRITRQDGFMIDEENAAIDLSKQPPACSVKLSERPNASMCVSGTCPRKSMPSTSTHETPRQPVDYESLNQQLPVPHGPQESPINVLPEPALDRSSFLLNQRRRQSRPRANSLSLRKEIEKRGNALTKENVTFHEFLEEQELRDDFKEQYLKGWKPPVPAIVFEDDDEENETGEASAKTGCNVVAQDQDPPGDLAEFGPKTFYQHRHQQYLDAEREHQTNLDKINKYFASQRPKLLRNPFRTGH